MKPNDAKSQWFEGELERPVALFKATSLHKAYMARGDMPTSQVPSYLEARVAVGHALPRVEVVSVQPTEEQQGQGQTSTSAGGRRKAAEESGDAQGTEAAEVEEFLDYVLEALGEELVTELLEGFNL
jgi:hypothetical protein